MTLLTSFFEIGERYHARKLASWCEYELHGYPEFEQLPDYRILNCQQFGLFESNSPELKHMEQIHDDCLAERDRCKLRYMRLRGPVLEYLQHPDNLKIFWPHQILSEYSRELIPGLVCIQAWQACDRPMVPWMLAGTIGQLNRLLEDCGTEIATLGDKEVQKLSSLYPDILALWLKHQRPTPAPDPNNYYS